MFEAFGVELLEHAGLRASGSVLHLNCQSQSLTKP